MTPEARKKMGQKGKQHVMKNYSFEGYKKKWVDLMLEIHEKNGSWENRKNYYGIRFEEVA